VNPANGAPALQLTVLGLLFVVMGLLTTVVVALAAGPVSATFCCAIPPFCAGRGVWLAGSTALWACV
tara:strand:+ start:2297 stop:2497 length:201 start_codon:yes stop_codon:yes gene_type:complete